MKKRGIMEGIFRRVAAVSLAGCLFLCGSLQAEAATMRDLFDGRYYADKYSDLKEAFGDDESALWNHFVTHGLDEKRVMNGLLDVVGYRDRYADLNSAFGDDWDAYVNHYLTFGVKEGRDAGIDTDFDALDYAERYEDLRRVFGDDVLALWNHYRTMGQQEGRDARTEAAIEAEREAGASPKQETTKPLESQSYKAQYWLPVSYVLYDEEGSLLKQMEYRYDSYGFINQVSGNRGYLNEVSHYDEAARTLTLTSSPESKSEYYFDESGMISGRKWRDMEPIFYTEEEKDFLLLRCLWLDEDGFLIKDELLDCHMKLFLKKDNGKLSLGASYNTYIEGSIVEQEVEWPTGPDFFSILWQNSVINDDGTVTTTLNYKNGAPGEVVVWKPVTQMGFWQNVCFDWDYTYSDAFVTFTISLFWS